MKLVYTKDICGNDILQDEMGKHQVMMEWEKPYMEACIDKLDISGSVLEIGFGLGYSARRICSSPHITEYTVIECSPVVWNKVEEFREEFPSLKINLVKGRWQDVLYTTACYDRCFFDDYIHDAPNPGRFLNFLYSFLPNHANIGCIIGSFSTGSFQCDILPWIVKECERYIVDIPGYCKYAKGTKMYINKLTKMRNPTAEEVTALKECSSSTELEHAGQRVLSVNANATFTPVIGMHTRAKTTFAEIEHLYFAKRDTAKLAQCCGEYLQENKCNDRQRRMVQFFYAFSLFHSDPTRSRELFASLLETRYLEDDVRGWTTWNLDMLS